MMDALPPAQDAASEIESLKKIVERYFHVYEVKLNADTMSFACQVDKLTLDEDFRKLRSDITGKGYTPVITYQRGEYTITIGKLPPITPKGVWINVVLLIATIVTTVLAGMELWASYSGKGAESFLAPETVLMGALTFALPVMMILGVHEMSHYYAAKKHGVPASLPFFIPAPFLFIGTFGAFISIRGPIPDRKSLFDLGVAGPIAGFLAAIPVAIVGSILTTNGAVHAPVESGGAIMITMPLIYQALGLFMPVPDNLIMHPTAMAGWVGFLVTAINLLPAGSLDGGHVARAIFGPKYRYASWASILILLVLGMFLYSGWLIFALLILMLGTDHAPPLNDISQISPRRKIVSLAIAGILVSCFAIVPMEQVPADYSFDASIEGSTESNVSLGVGYTYVIFVESQGTMNTTLVFSLHNLNNTLSPNLTYRNYGSLDNITSSNLELPLPAKQNATAYLTISITTPIQDIMHLYGDSTIYGDIVVTAKESPSDYKRLSITVTELGGNYTYSLFPKSLTMGGNQTRSISVNVTNEQYYSLSLQVTLIAPAGWSAWAYDVDPANATSRLNMTVAELSSANFTVKIGSPLSVTSGDTVVVYMEIMRTDNSEIRTTEIDITTA